MTTFTIAPGPLGAAFEDACARLDRLAFADALWNRRPDVFTKDPAVQRLVANRLGWVRVLDVRRHARRAAARVRRRRSRPPASPTCCCSAWAARASRRRSSRGSSASPPASRVSACSTRSTPTRCAPRWPTRAACSSSSPASRARPSSPPCSPPRPGGAAARPRPRAGAPTSIAITDPDTVLQAQAQRESFRDVFVNPPDIGGRYSALSLFGLVPAALMGVNLDALLGDARAMADACRQPRRRREPRPGARRADGRWRAEGPRQADAARAAAARVAGALGRTAGRGEHRQAGRGRRADRRRRCRRAVRRRTACSWRSRSARTAPTPAAVARARASGAPFAEWRMPSATRARRRVLPLGGGDRGRGRAARHQPVRRAERLAGQGRHAGPARHLPHPAAPARAGGRTAPIDGARFTLSHTALESAGSDPLSGRLQRRAAARLRRPCSPICRPTPSPSTPPSATCARRSRPGPAAPACRVRAALPPLHRPAPQGRAQLRRVPRGHRGAAGRSAGARRSRSRSACSRWRRRSATSSRSIEPAAARCTCTCPAAIRSC